MDTVNLLIKPASGLCNMRCGYCFYHDLAQHQSFSEGRRIMSRETADILIDRAVEEAEREIVFSFQGGEPTLAGLDFFRYFIARAAEKIKPGITLRYAIQTNGMLIDGEWAEFLAENGFLVGLSLDGPPEMNDMHRVDMALSGTHKRIMAAAKALEKAGAEFNILTVVTAGAARHGRRLYTWMKKQGFRYLQFIACLDPLGEERGREKHALTPEKYGTFLCELFDMWYGDWKKGDYVSIRLFDDYVHMAAGMGCSTCAASGQCGGYLVAESDGSVYPCDFYVTDDWRLGNLHDLSFSDLMRSEKNLRFISEAEEKPAPCAQCPHFSICRGGCRRDRQLDSPLLGENYLCPAFMKFFDYARPRILEMAAAERRALAGRH